MIEPITLETNRLKLVGITPAIIHELYNTKSKEEIKAFFGFDDAGYLHFKKMHEGGIETYNISLYVFLLINKETNLPIGDCGFHTWNKKHRRAEAFYLLRNDDDKRKGFMKEAFKEVIQFGFNKLKLHRISAMIADENTASKKLLLKYGFKKEGVAREDYYIDGIYYDSDCYSLLVKDWAK